MRHPALISFLAAAALILTGPIGLTAIAVIAIAAYIAAKRGQKIRPPAHDPYMALNRAKNAYVNGPMTLEEFEDRVDTIHREEDRP